MVSAAEAAQRAVVRAVSALPTSAVRALAGRPVVLDGQRLDAEMQLGVKLVSLWEPDGPRTPAGARARTARSARLVNVRVPAVAAVEELALDGAAGPLRARLYRPSDPTGALLVFFHGGGFVVGDLDTHDLPCRFLAQRSGAAVLSVDYRLAPEHRFPAAVHDAGRLPLPALQVLVYPGTHWDADGGSRARFADGFLLTAEDIAFYRAQYLPDDAAARDPLASPLLADDLAGVPPAYVMTAGFDPLRDEAEAYAERLAAAGVPVALRREAGLVHGFLNAVCTSRSAALAVAELAGAIRMALATHQSATTAS